MAKKSVDNILESIEKSKGRSLAHFIYALGIRHVGGETAEILAKRYKSIDNLKDASEEELVEIDTIGPKIAGSVTAFFENTENIRIIEKLKKANALPYEERIETTTLPLSDKEFVITGKLQCYSRQEVEARIKSLGGSTKSDITRRTDYLVVGEEPGSKLARANQLGIEQIDERTLLKIMGDTE
jgi:DNA ligase (NAD+)